MATQRVQIPISFSYPSTVFVANSSGGATTTSLTTVVPAAGSTVTILDRNTGNPATVYAAATGGTTISPVVTDSAGNVPGYVVEGSYSVSAAAVGSFAGATLNWEAVRGDGVENIFPGAVSNTALSTAVTQALVPTGTILDFAGSAAPSGYHLCDGSIQSQSGTFAALFAVIGSTYNTGGEGAGNFRLPNLQQRFALGKATSGTGSTLGSTGGSIDHTHSVPALSIPSLSVPSHNHPLGTNAAVQLAFGGFGGAAWLFTGSSFSSVPLTYANTLSGLTPVGGSGSTATAFPLMGHTDSTATSTNASSTGTGTSGTANPPYLVVQKIIKL